MTLTLDEVRQTRFHIARRAGYEVTDVDNFVDKVEATMMFLTDENDTLKKQLSSVGGTSDDEPSNEMLAENERLRREIAQLRAAGTSGQGAAAAQAESLRRENEELQRRLRETQEALTQAKQQQPAAAAAPLQGARAERIVVEASDQASPAVVRLVQLATQQAEQLVGEAEDEARRTVEEANRQAHEITVDARTKAERVESEARVNAQRLTSDAQSKADNLEHEVADRRRELFAALESERDQLKGRVHELRTFETQFRGNLTDHLKGHISALEKGVFEPGTVPGLLQAEPTQEGEQPRSATPRLDALLGDGEQ